MKTGKKRKGLAVLLAVLLVLLLTIAATAIWFFSVYFSVDLDNDTLVVSARNLSITDANNEEIPINSALGKYTEIADISPNIIHAFIATEDKRFYQHKGVDYKRTVGALIHNIQAGYAKEGGSTITQQLIKNTKLNNEKSIDRKIKEMRLAFQIEKEYQKDEILEMYLNAIYFGNGIYGIHEACKRYFDKTPLEIDVPEAAVLAGVVKNPRKNSLLNSVENANARKNLILRLMFEQNYIEETEYDTYLNTTVTPIQKDENYRPYSSYVDGVLTEASELLGITEKELIEGNYRVLTYLDRKTQVKMYDAYQKGDLAVTKLDGSFADYCAAALNNNTGGMSAFVGSVPQSVFDFRRQPGSAIKPFLSYLPALEYQNVSALTKVEDFRGRYGDYEPKNYKDSYLGTTTLRQAVATSSNAVAVRLLYETGIERAKSLATRCGINFHADDTTLPIALGGMTEGVTILEMLQAYQTLAAGGDTQNPSFVKAIFDQNGKALYQRYQPKQRAFSVESAALMTDMLQYNATNGTAKKLKSLPYDVAAKTGTVGVGAQNSDAWCAAYTTDYTVLGWYGSAAGGTDNWLPETLTGGSYPAIVCRYLLDNLQTATPQPFDHPSTVSEIKIDKKLYDETGEMLLVPDDFPQDMTLSALFHYKNAPTLYSPNGVVTEPEGFNVEIYEFPLISFYADETMIYHIYRQDLVGKTLLETVQGVCGEVILDDPIAFRNDFVTYQIDATNTVGMRGTFYKNVLY